MIKVQLNQYERYIPQAQQVSSNQVYPLSIAEGMQSGDIYTDSIDSPKTVLFWHYCGFAYIAGSVSEELMEEITEDICFKDRRRMVLITDDESAVNWLKRKNYRIAQRLEYDYAGSAAHMNDIPGIDIRKIDEDNINMITGRIIPAFSWENEQFLQNGSGYAAFDHDQFCGAVFSAAISSYETDLGVEVSLQYRNRGIASMLVQRMCNDIILQGKRPVWAHGEQNAGSRHTALKCGFVQKKMNCFSCLKEKEQ